MCHVCKKVQTKYNRVLVVMHGLCIVVMWVLAARLLLQARAWVGDVWHANVTCECWVALVSKGRANMRH